VTLLRMFYLALALAVTLLAALRVSGVPWQSGATPTRTLTPAATPPPVAGCTIVVSSVPELKSAVASAANGATVCVKGGTYGAVTLSARRTWFVNVRPASAAPVTFDDLDIGPRAAYIRVRGMHVTKFVDIGTRVANTVHHIQFVRNWLKGIGAWAGATDLLIEHNEFRNCGNCIELTSTDPTTRGVPSTSASLMPPVQRVTIRGNRITGAGTDALYITNYRDVVIENNEISGIVENGEHNDCLQSTWGGKGLVYRGNYLHDNRCQGFFIKDGLVSNVTVEDNLMIRNHVAASGVGQPAVIQIYNVLGLQMRHNTIWTDDGQILRYDPAMGPKPNANVVAGNVLSNFTPYDDTNTGDRAGVFKQDAVLSENRNVIKQGWTWLPSELGAHSLQLATPAFRDSAHGDWRLTGAVSRNGVRFNAGVTWKVTDKHFGP
jgi:hypothetical protein